MAHKSTSPAATARFLRYKTERKWEKNRIRKLNKALRKNPNNEQIKQLLAQGTFTYRRSTPKTRVWSKSAKHTANLFKQFTGFFDKNMFHADPKISQPALFSTKVCREALNKSGGSMFSIKERTQWA